MPFATIAFQHLDDQVTNGEEVADDHPLYLLRPDLFLDTKPTKTKKGAN